MAAKEPLAFCSPIQLAGDGPSLPFLGEEITRGLWTGAHCCRVAVGLAGISPGNPLICTFLTVWRSPGLTGRPPASHHHLFVPLGVSLLVELLPNQDRQIPQSFFPSPLRFAPSQHSFYSCPGFHDVFGKGKKGDQNTVQEGITSLHGRLEMTRSVSGMWELGFLSPPHWFDPSRKLLKSTLSNLPLPLPLFLSPTFLLGTLCNGFPRFPLEVLGALRGCSIHTLF